LFFVLIGLTSLSWARPTDDADKTGLPLEECKKEDGGPGTAQHVEVTIADAKVVKKTVIIPAACKKDKATLKFIPTLDCKEKAYVEFSMKGVDGKPVLIGKTEIANLHKGKPVMVEVVMDFTNVMEGTMGELMIKVYDKGVVLCRNMNVRITKGVAASVVKAEVEIPTEVCPKADGGPGTTNNFKITISAVTVIGKTVHIPVDEEHDMVLTFTPSAACKDAVFKLFLKDANGKEVPVGIKNVGELVKDQVATVKGVSWANAVTVGTKGTLIFKMTCIKKVVLCRAARVEFVKTEQD